MVGEQLRDESHDGVTAEFQRLTQAYTHGSVTQVTGALGPLYYAPITIAGEVVDALVDPASIMSFNTFKRIGPKAGIEKDDLRLPDVVLRNYSRQPIAIGAPVDLEMSWQGKTITSPVYVRSCSETAEPLLLENNVIVPLGMMQPGQGVEARQGTQKAGGVAVQLVKSERVPGRCGVVVEARVDVGDGD